MDSVDIENINTINTELKNAEEYIALHPILNTSPLMLRHPEMFDKSPVSNSTSLDPIEAYLSTWDVAEQDVYRNYYEDEI